MSSDILLSTQQAAGRGIPVSQLFTRKELVGKGAYGGVYKGVHNQTGTVVALKVIDLDTPDDDISEIQKEVALLSEMRDAARHNITLYHGCFLNGHELWIAMDFASGGSIRTLMKSGPIDEKYISLIVREILVALAFLHRQNIIHRDVKAANILLTQVGKILLCDFGVAAHLQSNNKRSTFIGTPLWMAPEVITDGRSYDTKADIWSLGVTMYEIATGNPPYFDMEPLRACALIPKMAPAKLDGGPWSASMRDFLALCLQVDPTNRPVADELSKTKWIKSGSKFPMALLKELITRYVGWIQLGGQRMSIAGLDNSGREDTFEIEDDVWDFSSSSSEDEVVEGLPDEPPRTLDAQAAISSVRPPKINTTHANNISRNHPLLRLFDTESNPYASATPTQPLFSLPTGAASMDTVRPLISIPSFEEMDEMEISTPAPRIADPPPPTPSADLATPTTVRPNPFSWTQQPMRRRDELPPHSASLPPPTTQTSIDTNHTNAKPQQPIGFPPPLSPRFRELAPESPWGTTTLESFNDSPIDHDADYYPSSTPITYEPPHTSASSASLSSLPSSFSDNRPFTSRRRADTAPSFEPSPFGPPSAPPYQSQYSQRDFQNGSSMMNGYGNRPFVSATHSANPSLSYSLPPSSSASTSFSSTTTNASNATSSTTISSSLNWSPPLGASLPASTSESRGGTARPSPMGFARSRSAMDNGTTPDANRPFRERKGSDATMRGGLGFGSRSRTFSDPRPPLNGQGGSQKFNPGLKISTTNGTNGYSHLTNGPPSGGLHSPPSPTQLTPLASNFLQSDLEFTGGPGDVDFEPDEDYPPREPWPSGPTLEPLDYGKLVSADDVHLELEKTLDSLAKWLVVVDDGLGRILSGSASNPTNGAVQVGAS